MLENDFVLSGGKERKVENWRKKLKVSRIVAVE